MSEDGSAENPLRVFAQHLQDRRAQAGAPSLRRLEKLTERAGRGYPRATIYDKLTGKSFPDWEFVRVFLAACALPGAVGEDDLQEMRAEHDRLLRELSASRAGRRRAAEVAEQLVKDTGVRGLVNLLLQERADFGTTADTPSSSHSRRVRTLVGHTGWVAGLAFSPDGTLLATASEDRTVRMWGMPAGTPVRVLTGHTGPVRCVKFSPDGILLASAAHDQTVRIWEPATGRPVRTLAGHAGGVNGVAFSPDGSHLAVAIHGWEQTVRVFATETGGQERALDVHHKAYNVVFSPDGSQLATSGWDRAVRLWDR